jgi:hypothetical protein
VSTVVEVVVLVVTWTAAVGLFIARTQAQRLACLAAAFTALAARAWSQHDGNLWVGGLALVAVWALAMLIVVRRAAAKGEGGEP